MERAGLDPATALEVINASSGRSAASEDKFPRHVLTGTFDSGLPERAHGQGPRALPRRRRRAGAESRVVAAVVDVWQRFAAAEPAADFTRIAEFVARAARP